MHRVATSKTSTFRLAAHIIAITNCMPALSGCVDRMHYCWKSLVGSSVLWTRTWNYRHFMQEIVGKNWMPCSSQLPFSANVLRIPLI